MTCVFIADWLHKRPGDRACKATDGPAAVIDIFGYAGSYLSRALGGLRRRQGRGATGRWVATEGVHPAAPRTVAPHVASDNLFPLVSAQRRTSWILRRVSATDPAPSAPARMAKDSSSCANSGAFPTRSCADCEPCGCPSKDLSAVVVEDREEPRTLVVERLIRNGDPDIGEAHNQSPRAPDPPTNCVGGRPRRAHSRRREIPERLSHRDSDESLHHRQRRRCRESHCS